MIDEIKGTLARVREYQEHDEPDTEIVRILVEQAPAWLEHLIERVEKAEAELAEAISLLKGFDEIADKLDPSEVKNIDVDTARFLASREENKG